MRIYLLLLLLIVLISSIIASLHGKPSEHYNECVRMGKEVNTDMNNQDEEEQEESNATPAACEAAVKAATLQATNDSEVQAATKQEKTQPKRNASVGEVIQSPWSCQKTQLWNKDNTSSTDAYVIARKESKGYPQCAFIPGANTTDKISSCAVFEDKSTCERNLFDAKYIWPRTCGKNQMIYPESTCTQLRESLWQCRKVNDDTVYAVRKKNKDIECLGYTPDSCKPFNNLIECNNNLETVSSNRYLSCGEMMYELYGTDGYSKDGHHCKMFKNVVI